MTIYDVAIVGGGPAGIVAGIYAVRAGLKTIILEKNAMTGGQIADSSTIENWPGIKSISGSGLLQKFTDHAMSLGVEIKTFTNVTETTLTGNVKVLKTNYGEIQAKTLILATGARERKLNIPGESEYKGKGVSYCAVCDAAFFKDKDVIVIGGGDSAIDEGLYLTKFAKSVKVVHRRDKLRTTKILQDRAFKNEKMKLNWNKLVEEIVAKDGKIVGVKVKDKLTEKESIIEGKGVFIYVGTIPNSKPFLVKKDEHGYIETDNHMATNIPGVFAAGDVRHNVLKQVITASSDGAIAAISAEKYLSEKEN